MSAKKSWDIQPRARPVARPVPAAAPVRISVRPARSTRGRTAAPLARGERLRSRRMAARRRVLIALGMLVLLLIIAGFYALWQPFDRIQHVEASGADADTISSLVTPALSGTYFHIIPKDSVFFYPKDAVRQAVLDADPNIAAVSLTRTSLTSVSVSAIPRAAVFMWCGESRDAPSAEGNCYAADSDGFLFATYPAVNPLATSTATTSAPLPSLPVYAALTSSSTDPLRATVANPAGIVGVLRFARAMATLRARVASVQIRGDEADLFTTGGTRITYVLGDESAAASLAATAFPNLDLNSGSLDYIDLRFYGKVYYKAK